MCRDRHQANVCTLVVITISAIAVYTTQPTSCGTYECLLWMCAYKNIQLDSVYTCRPRFKSSHNSMKKITAITHTTSRSTICFTRTVSSFPDAHFTLRAFIIDSQPHRALTLNQTVRHACTSLHYNTTNSDNILY